jgi:hypothetical protein
MITALVQISLIVLITIFLLAWRKSQQRRNAQSWEQILVRLRHDWSAHTLSEHFLWRNELILSPEETWKQMQGPRGLVVMYHNASVMLELVDFAVKNSDELNPVDPMVIAALRSDAMQIRLLVIAALVQYAFLRATAGVRTNTHRAAALYTEMAATMTTLLQEHAALILPDFVAAM